MTEQLKVLIQKRGLIKSQITRLRTYFDTCTGPRDVSQLRLRLVKVELTWNEFNQIQSEIEIIDPTIEQSDERELFENSYFKITSEICDFIQLHTMPTGSQTTTLNDSAGDVISQPGSTSFRITDIKLPTINLPKFNGQYEDWVTFYDTFKSLIHENNNLAKIQKFHYLKSSLTGEAITIIQSIELTADNYTVAWNLLRDRYENEKLIIKTHVKNIFELPNVLKESSSGLRQFTDGLTKNIRALEALGQHTKMWDPLMNHIIFLKLDPITQREFESNTSDRKLPTLSEIITFLNQRCRILEAIETARAQNNKNVTTAVKNIRSNVNISTNNNTCKICRNAHPIYTCDEFKKLPVSSRIQEIKRLRLCLNCLKGGHFSNDCTSSHCRKCSKPHNTLLHLDPQNANVSNDRSQEVNATATTKTSSSHCSINVVNEVILSTAIILILDHRGNEHKCRALLDTGSQSNFITTELSNRLNLKSKPIHLPVSGIGHITTNIKNQTRATIKSRYNGYRKKLNFLILPKITENIPNINLNINHLKIPNTIKLADNTFHKSDKIDMLIGADTFYDLLCVGQIKLAKGQPILQKTQMGWIISGNLDYNPQQSLHSMCHLNISTLDTVLKKFWEIEEAEDIKQSHMSKEEIMCENLFASTTTRDKSGRFTISLPFRDNVTQLGQSEKIAHTRLSSLERKMRNNPKLREHYNEFMKEYEDLGHMSLVPEGEINKQPSVYLPHHAVFKEDSTTTKIRVVFDGSAETTSGISLNDVLNVGPTIQNNLFETVIRFRTHTYVVTADIAKMYRQINVVEHHRDYQRILWRYDESQPIRHYRLNTVTYGTSPAPFLAIRSVKQLCIDEKDKYPKAAAVAERDFYVDDLLTGAETIDEINAIVKELLLMFKSANMELRKWSSNDPRIMTGESSNSTYGLQRDLGHNDNKKTLGLIWNPKLDHLTYSVKVNNDQPTSKRTILSTIAQIYDPMGLIGPVTIKAKCLLQKLWQSQVKWDESVPIDVFTTWMKLKSEFISLNQLRVPRHVLCKNPITIQLHAFCDASESAYGACIYLRTTNEQNDHFSTLLCAKARVAPLKCATLPRLELCGAVIAAKLAQRVKHALSIEINETFCWTDSSIVLAWIATPPNKLKTFVANRIAQIQQFEHVHWNHVRSVHNPADVISRGVNPELLMENNVWWNGPVWLTLNEDQWPPSGPKIDKGTLETISSETRTQITCLTVHQDDYVQNLFTRYSSFSKLQRIIAYCYRFCENAKPLHSKGVGALTISEINQAKIVIIRNLQQMCFETEISQLKRGNLVHKGSKLSSLNPFIDKNDVIRVGGRLSKADDLSHDQKHPIVLPSDHIITHNIIRDHHILHLHCGPQALLAAVRLQYWPLKGKYLAKRITHGCVTCYKHKPKPVEYIMGDLPTSRIDGNNRPFTVTGVDYCGPYQLKQSNTRGRPKLTKAYVSIFICFATKAVHLELVSDLTSEAFLGALRRFTARRGLPSDLHSDNGTNFVGANRRLRELYDFLSNQQDNIKSELIKHNINWHFNPPKSPHFGGLWEAAVKSFKIHLNKVTNNIVLTYEEMNTLIIQIEACLNSRPLTSLTQDPNDLYVLTPSHFLIGDSLLALNESDNRKTATNLLSRWQHLVKMKQHFWQRWHREYLHHLQQRTKWRSGADQLKIGRLVMLMDDNLPPQRWSCGRITELHPGSDGIIRVVKVKTASGIYSRSSRRVCLLPLPDVCERETN